VEKAEKASEAAERERERQRYHLAGWQNALLCRPVPEKTPVPCMNLGRMTKCPPLPAFAGEDSGPMRESKMLSFANFCTFSTFSTFSRRSSPEAPQKINLEVPFGSSSL